MQNYLKIKFKRQDRICHNLNNTEKLKLVEAHMKEEFETEMTDVFMGKRKEIITIGEEHVALKVENNMHCLINENMIVTYFKTSDMINTTDSVEEEIIQLKVYCIEESH